MTVNMRTVGPKRGGGWQVTGGDHAVMVATQHEGIDEARRELLSSGGGELRIKGRNGRVREQDTVRRPDPRRSMG